jgi:hypothetical protein
MSSARIADKTACEALDTKDPPGSLTDIQDAINL